MIIALVFKTLDDDEGTDELDKKENAKARADEELTDENLITLSQCQEYLFVCLNLNNKHQRK